jgi:hypothetical protein
LEVSGLLYAPITFLPEEMLAIVIGLVAGEQWIRTEPVAKRNFLAFVGMEPQRLARCLVIN